MLPEAIRSTLPKRIGLLLRSPPPSPLRMQGIALTCAALATLGRALMTPLVTDSAPFLSFFPAVLVAGLWAGPWGGLSALVYSSLVVDYFWLPPFRSLDLDPVSFRLLLMFWLFGGSLVVIAALLRALVRETAESEERATMLAAEMTHRMRNVLGLVQAISRQTFRTAAGPAEFQAMFEARISALGRAQDLIAADPERPADLKQLLDRVLEPFDISRFRLSGPSAGAPREISATLALLIHELGTNAAKYGALSTPAGEVAVIWEREQDRVRLDWKETKGPSVAARSRTGFGTRLLKTAFPQQLGEATIAFEADGVRCRIGFTAAAEKRGPARPVRASAAALGT